MFRSSLALLLVLAACGSNEPTNLSPGETTNAAIADAAKKKVKLSVTPTTAQLQSGDSQQFTATVTGSTNTAVTWTATGGTIDSAGKFTAGTSAGSFSVIATSQASKTAKATAAVTIGATTTTSRIKHVFVIAMENQDSNTVYGNANAPYLNGTIMKNYGYATNYGDDLTSLPSEPHYVFMEAGTNAFSDTTFKTDSDPSAKNSTASTAHLASQAPNRWMSYQEDLPAACPVKSVFPYATKHDPFVFFRDVSFTNGAPDANNAYCASHHRDFSALATDLAANTVADYNFITPNLCNDMHGDSRCTNGCTSTAVGSPGCVSAGDAWLATHLPPLIAFANANDSVIFIVWDEAEATARAPFFAIGPHMRQKGMASAVSYGHASLTKSVDEALGLSVLDAAATANDFSDFFEAGTFP